MPSNRLVEIVFVGQGAEAGGGGFGGEVALGRAEHLEADHELADFGGAQQRRVEVRVEVHSLVRLAMGGALVEAQAIGERDLEEVVVAGGDGLKDVGKGGALGRRE